ncbi:hypothetical protein TRFO_26162 [Tritrichomonas foetus]|uniref:Uncharacterized protein n=1 Tax=Tritrichomonas foetus TaxID=1144522 RepID=A0A1J4K432_9EUKA|nr:hypothetical protein TRFO_26162 [Tritrichomonas foetus]|eukprot:OHT05947.1 hypothetical protein TRFO_26162 [Tritrichomonas foetus]
MLPSRPKWRQIVILNDDKSINSIYNLDSRYRLSIKLKRQKKRNFSLLYPDIQMLKPENDSKSDDYTSNDTSVGVAKSNNIESPSNVLPFSKNLIPFPQIEGVSLFSNLTYDINAPKHHELLYCHESDDDSEKEKSSSDQENDEKIEVSRIIFNRENGVDFVSANIEENGVPDMFSIKSLLN